MDICIQHNSWRTAGRRESCSSDRSSTRSRRGELFERVLNVLLYHFKIHRSWPSTEPALLENCIVIFPCNVIGRQFFVVNI